MSPLFCLHEEGGGGGGGEGRGGEVRGGEGRQGLDLMKSRPWGLEHERDSETERTRKRDSRQIRASEHPLSDGAPSLDPRVHSIHEELGLVNRQAVRAWITGTVTCYSIRLKVTQEKMSLLIHFHLVFQTVLNLTFCLTPQQVTVLDKAHNIRRTCKMLSYRCLCYHLCSCTYRIQWAVCPLGSNSMLREQPSADYMLH